MLRKIFYILIAILLFGSQKSEGITLSQHSEISVLTCGPSSLIHAIYGHTAIRVNDRVRGIDYVFNYGVFSFNAPNFVYRFAKGQTDYMLAPERFSDFYLDYKKNGRSITEQVLNLSQSEKQKLLDFLIWNAKPENREYRYNFFYDNCATRVRDVIEKQVDGAVVFPVNSDGRSFRDHVSTYQKIIPWMDFGIQLTLGSPSDKVANAYEEMFLPDFLMNHFGDATIQTGSEAIPLVKEVREIYVAEPVENSGFDILSPVSVLSVILLLVLWLSVKQLFRKRTNYFADYFLLFLTGIIGLAMLWFVFVSEHPAMKSNYSLFWAIPTNFVFGLLWFFKKWRSLTKWYWPALTLWLVLFLVFSSIIPQAFHPGFILIALMVLLRSSLHSYQFLILKK